MNNHKCKFSPNVQSKYSIYNSCTLKSMSNNIPFFFCKLNSQLFFFLVWLKTISPSSSLEPLQFFLKKEQELVKYAILKYTLYVPLGITLVV